jgi:NADH-ubiquinone oxidoreductase chain 4L
MNFIIIVFSLIVLVGLIIFCSKREHLLTMLLRLEYIILSLYFIINLLLQEGDIYFSLIFIVFTACEGALGLSILIVIRRSYGSDYFKSLRIFDR